MLVGLEMLILVCGVADYAGRVGSVDDDVNSVGSVELTVMLIMLLKLT